MSELTDALEATFSVLQASFPEQAKSFLPGLPKEKIRKTIGSLGLPCPDELVDLYHWRNGSNSGCLRYGFPPELIFLPLEEVVDNYIKCYRDCDELHVLDTIRWDYGVNEIENILSPLGIEENHKMLPFIDHGEGYFYSLIVSGHNRCIILDHREDIETAPCFDSLTAMLKTLQELYQENVYYPSLEEDSALGIHPEAFREILEKYNPLTYRFNASDLDGWFD
jgi:hypothetical protein